MRIFLDAGHNYSGFDTGAVGNGLREQDITFYVSKMVGDILSNAGVDVRLSRNNLTDNLGSGTVGSSLSVRSSGANSFNADLCVSIHCNAGGGTGAETYICAKGGDAEKLSNVVQSKLASLGLRDRGVKVANFHMLTAPKAPAILVELAFIDTVSDAAVLRDRQSELASAVAEGIIEFAISNKFLEELDMSKFNDVSGHYAEKHIEELGAMGVVNGTGDGKFLPDEPVKRGDVAIMIRNAIRYVTGK